MYLLGTCVATEYLPGPFIRSIFSFQNIFVQTKKVGKVYTGVLNGGEVLCSYASTSFSFFNVYDESDW